MYKVGDLIACYYQDDISYPVYGVMVDDNTCAVYVSEENVFESITTEDQNWTLKVVDNEELKKYYLKDYFIRAIPNVESSIENGSYDYIFTNEEAKQNYRILVNKVKKVLHDTTEESPRADK